MGVVIGKARSRHGELCVSCFGHGHLLMTGVPDTAVGVMNMSSPASVQLEVRINLVRMTGISGGDLKSLPA